ncbi:NUDIX hydrolase [Catalinimonas alkaloidigena]|uniref:NUDIX hydrolase n=1 Tax=Catalinimonas alkaloidigena TaxID=1075417 RepID=UPI002406AAFB|nr:CoA pyrophosphatase [Catalinimonas alkaloidigena]
MTQSLPGWEAQIRMSTQMHKNARLKPPKYSKQAAVLMLLFYHDDQLWMPLIQRPIYDGVHSGQMALPGGKYEAQDKDLLTTALRETHEEIGVKVERDYVIGQLSELYIPPSNITVSPFLAIIPDKPSYIPDPLEVANITEVGLKALQSPENYSEKEVKIHNGQILKAPSYQIAGKTIWGATAMMLSELLFLFDELD